MHRLGLIAGGGGLPLEVARACAVAGRPLFVLRLKGMADKALADFEGLDSGLGELGRGYKALKDAGCTEVCFAGYIARPNFAGLKVDLRGLATLPGVVAAAAKGDDALMRFMLGEFEREGFGVLGADEVVAALTIPAGLLGRHAPDEAAMADMQTAARAARAIGALDIGQAAVAASGVVLAVEAQEGTAAMLVRCADLPETIRGTPAARRGVLVKLPKPTQDRRVDLPTIGPDTIIAASRAGLAGIAGEAGALLLVERDLILRLADEEGLFVIGIAPGDG